MDNLGVTNWHVRWVPDDMVRWGANNDIEDYCCKENYFQSYTQACISAVNVLPTDIFGVVEVVELTCVPIPDYPDRTYAKPTRWYTVENVRGELVWQKLDDQLLRLSLDKQPHRC